MNFSQERPSAISGPLNSDQREAFPQQRTEFPAMQEPTLEEYPRTPKRKESIKESAERKFTVLLRRVSYDFSRGTSLDPLQNVEEHRIVSRNASIDLDPSLYCLNPQEFETASSSPNKRSSVSATNTFLSSAEQSVKEETASYCFSFANIPLQQQPVDGLTLRDFYGISEVAAGGNAFISRAVMRSNKTEVALKIMKETMQWNAVANSEFTMEFQILQRTNHLNIVRLLGAGRTPLRFLVLEWLGGATLQDRLSAPRKRSSVAEMFFQNAEVNWEETLSIGSQLADAMNYLHNQCHPEATIIHRDLKPENIGFTSNGTLKLFDFGLAICVKRFDRSTSSYQMSGNTGSLRYMAPEVARMDSYNEKVDVHSFGILLWQVASRDLPFKGFTREDYMKFVVEFGLRPDVPSSWPKSVKKLLSQCWDPGAELRPSFEVVVARFKKIMEELVPL